ncbi:MAG: hypothetical protein U0835_11475 [Isosphaeraceae bacterium]
MIRGRIDGVASGLATGALVLAMALLSSAPATGQSADAALKDRVGQLVERLGSEKKEAAQAAEDALLKLGARVLPLLPDAAKAGSPERKARLERIREKLREAGDQANLGASKVTLQVKGMRLSEVIQKLQASTGNAITDLREAEGGEASNPSLDLDIQDKPFLEALDIVCKAAEITPNFFTGDGTIGLMPGAPMQKGPVTYFGPFRVAFKQIGSVRDLQTGMSTASAQFEVAWEPRLRPMLLALKADEIKITDDRGKPIEAQVKDESTDVVLRPENPVAEINLALSAPEREAKTIQSIKVKADLTVPAGLKTFRFPNIAVTRPASVKQGDISVTLESTEVEESVWKLNVLLAYPGEGPAFESYRQGLFNNRLWLQRADGSRFEHNGGFSNTSSDGGTLGYEYLFVDAPGKPGDYGLVYETPSEVKTIPLEFEFKNVPLP